MADQISDKYKCIFIHVPKAAGSSIERSSIFKERKEQTGEGVWGHQTALEFKNRYPDKFAKYFKFTLVRNPYSRLVSAYFYLSRGGNRKPYDTEVFNKYFANTEKDFVSFCRNILSEKLIKDVLHFRPQYEFLCDEDLNVIVDFIGRQETYVKDVKFVFKTIGLPYEHWYSNRSETKHFSEYYTNDVREKVFNLYKLDFELLGYPFEIEKPNKFLYEYNRQTQILSFKALRKLRALQRYVKSK